MIDVPVIDPRGAPDEVAAAMDDALHRVGFMAVTGHGVDPRRPDPMSRLVTPR